jgi:nucleoside-diphosphate-sugar epimerase
LMESLLIGGVNGIPLTIEGSAATSDEYIYIKDLARAVALATLAETSHQEIVFNVGAGKKTTLPELCASLQKAVPGAILKVVAPEEPEAPPLPPLDVSRIRKAFGFSPEFDLVKGFTDYVSEARFIYHESTA